jgi:GGDEF domain-containing protein
MDATEIDGMIAIARTSDPDALPEVHVLDARTLVGRGPDADVRIDDVRLSRHHCVIARERGRWIVEDAGSTGGVFVNGEALAGGRRELVDRDRIALGGDLVGLVRFSPDPAVDPGGALSFRRELFSLLTAAPTGRRDDHALWELERWLTTRCYVLAIALDDFEKVVRDLGKERARRVAERARRAFRPAFDEESLVTGLGALGRWEVDALFGDDDAALRAAEAARTAIGASQQGSRGARITASIGVACEGDFPTSMHGSPFRACQEAARARLRHAVAHGGDRVVARSPGDDAIDVAGSAQGDEAEAT